jgi:hypothetical protein
MIIAYVMKYYGGLFFLKHFGAAKTSSLFFSLHLYDFISKYVVIFYF